MKKKLSLLVFFLCMSIGCIFVFSGCDRNVESYYITTTLTDISLDVDYASNLGVAVVNGRAQIVTSVGNDLSYEPVEYINADNQNFDINKTELEVYKLLVEKDFTFITYVNANIRKTLTAEKKEVVINGARYDMDVFVMDNYYIFDVTNNVPNDFYTTFNNTKFEHTYIMDNQTGKMYDSALLLRQINGFNDTGFVVKNGIFDNRYFLKVQNDQLGVEKLMPNSTITVDYSGITKDGCVYIFNNYIKREDEIKKIYYISDIFDNEHYFEGSDGYIYYAQNPYQENIVLKKLVNNQLVDVETDTCVYFESSKCVKALINGLLFVDPWANSQNSTLMQNEIKVFDVKNNFKMLYTNKTENWCYNIKDNYVFTLSDKKFSVYKNFDFATGEMGEPTTILENCEIVDKAYLQNGILQTTPALQVVTFEETMLYKVIARHNNFDLEKITDTFFQNGILVEFKTLN